MRHSFWGCSGGDVYSSLAPGALLAFGCGYHHRLVVSLARVTINRGCGLGTEVASFLVEVEGANAVSTARAVELHATFDALDSIGFHCLNCRPETAERVHSVVGQRK